MAEFWGPEKPLIDFLKKQFGGDSVFKDSSAIPRELDYSKPRVQSNMKFTEEQIKEGKKMGLSENDMKRTVLGSQSDWVRDKTNLEKAIEAAEQEGDYGEKPPMMLEEPVDPFGGAEATAEGVVPSGVYVEKDPESDGERASFFNPQTKQYVWVPYEEAGNAAAEGYIPETKEQYLSRYSKTFYQREGVVPGGAAFGLGVGRGLTFGLAEPIYKAMAPSEEEYRESVGAAQEQRPILSGLGEAVGTLPWFAMPGGPAGAGVKAVAGKISPKLVGWGTKNWATKLAVRTFGDAALGAQIHMGSEFAKQHIKGEYDIGKIAEQAGLGGLTYGALTIGGAAAGKIIKKAVKKYVGGEKAFNELVDSGKSIRAAKIDLAVRAANRDAAFDAMGGLGMQPGWGWTPAAGRAAQSAQLNYGAAEVAFKAAEGRVAKALANEEGVISNLTANLAKKGLSKYIGGAGLGFIAGGTMGSAVIGGLGSAYILRPLVKKGLVAAGKFPGVIPKVKGALAMTTKALGGQTMALLTQEEIDETRENLSDRNLSLLNNGLESAFDNLNAPENLKQDAIKKQTNAFNLLREYLPKNENDKSGQIKYADAVNFLSNHMILVKKLQDLTLNKNDVNMLKTVDPRTYGIWRKYAEIVLKYHKHLLNSKELRVYTTLAGGEYIASAVNTAQTIQQIAFGQQEEKGRPSKADVPPQTSNLQRIEGKGLGSKFS